MSLNHSSIKRRTSTTSINTDTNEEFIGRVVDIILDDKHPEYAKYGYSDSIGLIKYTTLGVRGSSSEEVDEEEYAGIAVPLRRNSNLYPLKNEVVILTIGPSFNVENQSSRGKVYYQTVVSIYNHTHHNALPPTTGSKGVNIGEGIDEQSSLAPLQPLPGDHIIEGRLGQSLRFSGGLSEKSTWTDDTNKNKPITVLRNGQREVEGGFTSIMEDINEDATSIYLTSNHMIPLTLASNKRDTYDEKPDNPINYQGSQLLLNSDRLTLNAKKSDILISSAESIGLNSKSAHIDADDYMCFDADKIYLGRRARANEGANKQPVVLGHRMEAFLQDVLDQLIALSKAMGKAKTIKGEPIPTINLRGASAEIVINQLKRQLNPKGSSTLKSNKTFVE